LANIGFASDPVNRHRNEPMNHVVVAFALRNAMARELTKSRSEVWIVTTGSEGLPM
jgi:hypothetical protein